MCIRDSYMGVLIDNMFFKQHVDLKFASWYNIFNN